MRLAAGVLALSLLLASSAPAQDAGTIYRCTAAGGEVTIQNGVPCPAGSRQEVRKVEALPSRPPPAPSGGPAAAEDTLYRPPPLSDFVQVAAPRDEAPAKPERPDLPKAAGIAAADRLPPPPIYRCETWDNDSYISEDPAPKPRCVRLDTAGVGAACAGWKRRQGEIESGWRHAKAADKQGLQEDFVRVTKILQDTTCGLD